MECLKINKTTRKPVEEMSVDTGDHSRGKFKHSGWTTNPYWPDCYFFRLAEDGEQLGHVKVFHKPSTQALEGGVKNGYFENGNKKFEGKLYFTDSGKIDFVNSILSEGFDEALLTRLANNDDDFVGEIQELMKKYDVA